MKHVPFALDFAEPDGACLMCPNCPLPEDHPGECSCDCATTRALWYSKDLSFVDEALIPSLFRYRQSENRMRADYPTIVPNLVSSLTRGGKQLPIIDLDFPHLYVPSSTEGHGHLYLNRPVSKWRWFVLMCALRYAKVLNRGGFFWSIRRGQNFVRLKDDKPEEDKKIHYTYGWFVKKKEYR